MSDEDDFEWLAADAAERNTEDQVDDAIRQAEAETELAVAPVFIRRDDDVEDGVEFKFGEEGEWGEFGDEGRRRHAEAEAEPDTPGVD
jgi:hypothetical protein